MGTGSSKRTAQIVSADEKLCNDHTAINNTTSNTATDGRVLHNKGKPSKTTESLNEEGKSLLNDSNTNNVTTVRPRASQDGEDIVQDVDVESTLLLTSFSEKNPELEPRLISTKKHHQALKEALDSGNLMISTVLEHAKALIDVYSKCKKRSSKSVLTDFALALGISKLVYEIIVDRRTKYTEVTTWDRKPRTVQEKEQGNQEDENEDTPGEEENQVG
ncbi:uncharacterized protein LOC144648640 [Oculina patagonica]